MRELGPCIVLLGVLGLACAAPEEELDDWYTDTKHGQNTFKTEHPDPWIETAEWSPAALAADPELAAMVEGWRRSRALDRRGSRTVEDPRRSPTWVFAFDEPWQVVLGRGSGRSGLGTVELDSVGRAVITEYRAEEHRVVRVSVQLDPVALREALRTLIPTELKPRYRQPGVIDGTQWIFRIVQGDEDHLIYCDNLMPQRLSDFAVRIDELLEQAHFNDAPPTPPATSVDSPNAILWTALEAAPSGKPLR